MKPPRVQPCPVDGRCEEKEIVYRCTVTETGSGKAETYVGLSANTFKDRYTKHKKVSIQEDTKKQPSALIFGVSKTKT